jgi:hypothetical protein
MPRPIGATFGDLIGKLDVIVVEQLGMPTKPIHHHEHGWSRFAALEQAIWWKRDPRLRAAASWQQCTYTEKRFCSSSAFRYLGGGCPAFVLTEPET